MDLLVVREQSQDDAPVLPERKRQKTLGTATEVVDPPQDLTEQDRLLAAFQGEDDVQLSILASRALLDEKVACTLAANLCSKGAIYMTLGDDIFCLVSDWTDDQSISVPIMSFSERIRVTAPLIERKAQAIQGSLAMASVGQLRQLLPEFPVSSVLCAFTGTAMTPDCKPCHHSDSFVAHLWNVRIKLCSHQVWYIC